MTVAETVAENTIVARNLASAMAAYSQSSEAGEVSERVGATLVSSGINYPVFNAAVLTEPVYADAEVDKLLAGAAEFYRARGIGWSLWLSEDLAHPRVRAHLADEVTRYGLWHIAEHRAMMATRLRPAQRRVAPLEVRPVFQPDTREDFAHLCTAVFGMPADLAQRVYGREQFWTGSFRAWVGDLDGRAVTSAAIQPAAGAVGLYSVATVTDLQRQGYGEAITRIALRCGTGETGCHRTILQSTPAGMPLYRKLGYRPLGRVVVFATD